MGDTAPLLRKLDATIPAQGTAATASDQIVGEAPVTGVVTAVSFTPEAAIVGVVTNNRKFALVNKGADGRGAREVASITFAAGTDAVAFDEKALTLTAVAADLAVTAGDIFAIVETVNGTGMTHPGGLVQVEINRA